MADDQAETWREEAARLREEIDRVDDWANGVFAALLDVMLPLLRTHPEMAVTLAPMWQKVAQRWDEGQTGQSEEFQEPAELLEPRKMLYRILDTLGAWPSHARG